MIARKQAVSWKCSSAPNRDARTTSHPETPSGGPAGSRGELILSNPSHIKKEIQQSPDGGSREQEQSKSGTNETGRTWAIHLRKVTFKSVGWQTGEVQICQKINGLELTIDCRSSANFGS